MSNNVFSNPASAAIFFAKFSRLDPATRRNVFRLLADDLYTAVDLAATICSRGWQCPLPLIPSHKPSPTLRFLSRSDRGPRFLSARPDHNPLVPLRRPWSEWLLRMAI
ncbi:hypothetical protein HBI17_037370 [Parastagonospora nodorum]|nr:hypothetical protein HBI17_037370 [Parastagonospora nodorum]